MISVNNLVPRKKDRNMTSNISTVGVFFVLCLVGLLLNAILASVIFTSIPTWFVCVAIFASVNASAKGTMELRRIFR